MYFFVLVRSVCVPPAKGDMGDDTEKRWSGFAVTRYLTTAYRDIERFLLIDFFLFRQDSLCNSAVYS